MARKPMARPRQAKPKRSNSEAQEIEELEQRLAQLDPVVASADGQDGQARDLKDFEDLPLSRYTLEGLKEAKYIEMTAIQKAALPHALTGQDVLGAAKTGSGKTLAFTIPVLEKLYRLKWGRLDGLGALIISPTRELAMQIFEELRKVGQRHDLSAGLLIGGKNVKEEQDRVNGMNILVATPGRLLQHMDETPGFDCSDLQVLVLDEADRILDMGFSGTLNAILQNVPVRRQTMLFSATQTKRVKDLVRLSLHDPIYIAIHAQSATPTPVKLQQAYVICELQNKMSILWAFVKSHLKAKVLVFLSTCKQVKYVYEVLRRLRPGVPLRCIHGKMKQMKRMAAVVDFTEDKGGSVLFATDVAGRGLDFPNVEWVVQMDCPEDLDSYIHRAGRTARFKSAGKSLLMLLPSEKEGMLQLLEERNIPIKPLKINPNKTQPIGPALQAMLSKNNELKELAQAALKSYLRSVFLQPNKAIFNVSALPAADYAASLGLASVPQMRFLKRAGVQATAASSAPAGASAPRQAEDRHDEDSDVDVTSDDEDADVEDTSEKDEAAAEARRGSGRAAGTSAAAGKGTAVDEGPEAGERHHGSVGNSSSDEDDLLVVKRHNIHDVDLLPDLPVNGTVLGVAKKKKKKALKIKLGKTTGSRVVFDEEGQALQPLAQLALPESNEGAAEEEEEVTAEQRFARLREELKTRDAADREAYRERRRQRAQAKKEHARGRAASEAATDAGGGARLAGAPLSDGEPSASGDEEGESNGEEQQERHRQSYDDTAGIDEIDGLDSDDDGGDMQRSDMVGRKRGRAGAAGGLPRKRLAPEPAHMDMAPAPQLGIGDLTVAQQEALALSMLSRKR